jgi:hypothetical protein
MQPMECETSLGPWPWGLKKFQLYEHFVKFGMFV